VAKGLSRQQHVGQGSVVGIPRACGVQHCHQATAEQKPFCLDHLASLPYVKALLARLSSREAEVIVAGEREPDASSPRAREIVNEIAMHGARSIARLGMDLLLPADATERYVRALEQAGLVELLVLGSRRGDLRRIVALRPSRPPLLDAV
jgi:hypothetical protein